jgi:hypothetical protein
MSANLEQLKLAHHLRQVYQSKLEEANTKQSKSASESNSVI